jgi:valyl-tRNA synthetase
VNSSAATPSLDGMAVKPLASDQAPLPSAPVAESYDHRETERRLAARWEELGLHRFEPASTKPIFSVDTPPPYVSAAHLHVGHAMSYSQAEFVIRFKRMTGHNIFYPMGFDDNGLPTERFVEKKYGLNKRTTTRAEFRALCIEETQAGTHAYEEMWRSLGLSVDWRQRYSTIDSHSTATAQRSFLDLHHKGLLYRSKEPVYWDTVDETSLAQADLEPVTRKSKLFDIVFGGPDGCQLIISTTRPELLPGCVALAYHPGDERHAALEGLSARVPLFDFAVPIRQSKDVDPKYGTGLMMICTFGDNDDVKMWRDLKLADRLVIDSRGRMTEDAGRFAGMPVAEARAQIVRDLAAEGLLSGHRVVDQSVAVGERSGQPVEFQMAPQWFIRILDRQAELLARADELQWHPPHMKARLDQWIEGLKYDWNISRQRFYGVPLPVWYVQETGDIIVADEADLPVDPTRDPPPSWAREKYAGMTIVGDSDVMDTWMTSSLSPLINMNWAGTPGRDGAPSMLPMPLRIQAFEIIRTWLFYTMVKSHFHLDALPWSAAMISGWGLNEQGRKISKRDLDEFTDADGYNRYDPKAVIDRYGADALRFWAAGAKLGHDLRYNEKDVRAGRKVVVKLWNVARLCEMYLSDFDPDADEVALEARPLEDRWLEARFAGVVRTVTSAFESFDYAAGREPFEKFFWATLCDNYLEIVKDRLWRPEVHGTSSRKAAQTTLWHILRGLLGLAAPYIPFVTDEIYLRHYAERERQSSLHATAWPQAGPAELDEYDELSMNAVLDTLDMLRQVRGHTKLPAGPWSKLVLEIPKADWDHLQPARPTLLAAMRCDMIEHGSGRYACGREGWSFDVLPTRLSARPERQLSA